MSKNTIRKKERKNWFYSYNMIFDQPISEHAKIVYLFLCRCADDEGQSFPSYKKICEQCSIKSRQTVLNAIKELESIGLLTREQRKNEKGGQTSNLYTIYDSPIYDTPCPADGHPPVQQMDTPLSSRWTPPVQQMDTPCPADGHKGQHNEGLPNEGLPIINNNTNVQNYKNVVDEKEYKKIKLKIEEITGGQIIDKKLKEYFKRPNAKEEIEQAIKNYPAIAEAMLKTKDIINPIGLFFYVASNNIQPPNLIKSRQKDSFSNFPQHEYSEEYLESLFEDISDC